MSALEAGDLNLSGYFERFETSFGPVRVQYLRDYALTEVVS